MLYFTGSSHFLGHFTEKVRQFGTKYNKLCYVDLVCNFKLTENISVSMCSFVSNLLRLLCRLPETVW